MPWGTPIKSIDPAHRGTVDGHWINARLLSVYPAIFIIIYAAYFIWRFATAENLVDQYGAPLGSDFTQFWAASLLALGGEPAAIYDWVRIEAAERIAVPALQGVLPWSYPPVFLLFVFPLALLPYLASYFLWCAATFAGALAAIRHIAPTALTPWVLLAFPATFINMGHGQNGFLTLALFGGAMAMMGKRPVLAGILIGLLAFKPQFGVLIPLALIMGRQWIVFFSASVTVAVLSGVSLIAFGADTWLAFWNNIPVIHQAMLNDLPPLTKMPSVFVSARFSGLDHSAAMAVHWIIAGLVTGLVAWAWWRVRLTDASVALLAVGSLFITPYLFDYDLMLLAVAIVFLARDGEIGGWMGGDREILLLAWISPFLVSLSASLTGFQIVPLCLLLVVGIAVRRIACTDRLLP